MQTHLGWHQRTAGNTCHCSWCLKHSLNLGLIISQKLNPYVVQLALILSKAIDVLPGHPINWVPRVTGAGSRMKVGGQQALGGWAMRSPCRMSKWHVLFLTYPTMCPPRPFRWQSLSQTYCQMKLLLKGSQQHSWGKALLGHCESLRLYVLISSPVKLRGLGPVTSKAHFTFNIQ